MSEHACSSNGNSEKQMSHQQMLEHRRVRHRAYSMRDTLEIIQQVQCSHVTCITTEVCVLHNHNATCRFAGGMLYVMPYC